MNNTYVPTNGMIHTAMEGLRLVESGKVTPDDIPVEVPEYSKKIADGQPIALADVASIVSHLFTNVSNRKKGWDDPENLTNKRINWQLQGGCQAFKWSHDIVAEAISNGELSEEEVPGYVTPEAFAARGGQY